MENMENPLMIKGAFFRLDLFRPAPTYSISKGHRISFEVDAKTWDMFKQADVKGMSITANATVVRYEEDIAKRPHPSNIAAMLCKDEMFWKFMGEKLSTEITGYEDANDVLLAYCKCNESKSELDRDDSKHRRFTILQRKYKEWLGKNAGENYE